MRPRSQDENNAPLQGRTTWEIKKQLGEKLTELGITESDYIRNLVINDLQLNSSDVELALSEAQQTRASLWERFRNAWLNELLLIKRVEKIRRDQAFEEEWKQTERIFSNKVAELNELLATGNKEKFEKEAEPFMKEVERASKHFLKTYSDICFAIGLDRVIFKSGEFKLQNLHSDFRANVSQKVKRIEDLE